MDMEHKSVQAEVKALNAKGEGVLRFIRFEQEDKDGDITRPGFIGRQKAVLLASHNWKSDYPPLGSGESYEEDGATNFRFLLNLDDQRAKTWYSWLKMDRDGLQQVSYGFSPYADATEKWSKDGRSGRYLKPRKDGTPGAKLHEVSFVVVGSGNDTAVLDMKAFDDLPAAEEQPGELDDLKAAGVRVQSLIFPKDKWDSAEAVRSWLSNHGYSTELDATGSSWRARQEDPGKFSRLRSFCINPSRTASAESCRVMAVGGPMKESRSMDHESLVVEPPAADVKDAAALDDIEDYTKYPEDRRPPLPVMIKWLRLYRYHIPFLRDIRKKDGKEITPETIKEISDLINELVEVGNLLNIKVMTSRLMPDLEEEARQKEHYNARLKELSADAEAEHARKLGQLQAKALELEGKMRERERVMRSMFASSKTS
jgi:hypothetical protein